MTQLSPRREKFAREFIVDHNVTQACTRAGYSALSARNTGYRLMQNADVKARIDELLQPEMDEWDARRKRVIDELELIAFQDTKQSLIDFGVTGGPALKTEAEIDGRLISSVSESAKTGAIKVATWNKVRALELLGKYSDMEKQHIDVTTNGENVNGPPQITFRVVECEEDEDDKAE